jgi:hypothetical protein
VILSIVLPRLHVLTGRGWRSSKTSRDVIPGLGRTSRCTWFFALALLWELGARSWAQSPPSRNPLFIRGVALGEYSAIQERELKVSLGEIKHLGADYVSLVVSWSMEDIHSTKISPLPERTPSDSQLLLMARRAQELGLRVFLFPILDVKSRKLGEWRGSLKPPDWHEWWRNYRRFVLHYAAIAAQGKMDLFCVGSELVSTETMRSLWQHLIGRVRKVYGGSLVYSANWDHYSPVGFWDLVDVIGLTAYYKLAEGPNASEEEMFASWLRVRRMLVPWVKKTKRPLLFTEVGYPSLMGGAVTPWDYTLSTSQSPEEQRRAYRAFVRAWSGVPELAGVFFWNWYGEGGPKDKGYTPRGKPAERVIRQWYHSMGSQ